MVTAYISAAINGALVPAFALLLGDMINKVNPNSQDDLLATIGRYSLYFLALGAAQGIFGYIGNAAGIYIGERQALAFRKEYFKAIIRQEIGFFDALNPNELASTVAQQCVDYMNGVGEKVVSFFNAIGMALGGFIIGYIKGWQLGLLTSACLPLISLSGALYVKVLQKIAVINNLAYTESGGIAEECLSAIRTVVSLGGQDREMTRYRKSLLAAKDKVIKFFYLAGFGMGAVFFSKMVAYGIGFWYGSRLIANGTINGVTGSPYNLGDVITVLFSVLMGSQSLGQITPTLGIFADARVAATDAFKIMDRKSLISIEDQNGEKPETITGNINFKNVKFSYPNKKEKMILNGVTFNIRKNQKTAFVGESGCGKTTSMQLIERFYDINEGSIELDGKELKNLNLSWLRSKIGYVGQEPVLFASTIRENMLLAKEDATDQQIWEALRHANAAEFIEGLPAKLDTYVGASGTQLSGGQKQRIAIARAILKNPPILLLDEATSALDRKNEAEIQKTLDEISNGRTTIVIAHRLTTIINADHIIVFEKGNIVEEGNHEELIAKKGKYYELQRIQLNKPEEEEPSDLEEPENEANTEVSMREPKSPKKVFSSRMNSYLAEKEIPKHKEEHTGSPVSVIKRLLNYDTSHRKSFIFAVFCTLVSGAVTPFYSVIIAYMLKTYGMVGDSTYDHRSIMGLVYFLICAVVSLLAQTLRMGAFGRVSQELILKLRSDLFSKFLKLHISYFDQPENTPGALSTKLANECAQVRVLTTTVVGVYLTIIACYLTGLGIAYEASWILGLIATFYTPLILLFPFIQTRMNKRHSVSNDKAYEEAGSFFAEAVNNMRTVASFGKEKNLCMNYDGKLEGPRVRISEKANVTGVCSGIVNLLSNGMSALLFYVGGVLIYNGKMDFIQLFRAFFALMISTMSLTQFSSFAPDVGGAKASAQSIFKVLDTKPEIDIDDPSQNVTTPIVGNIEFKNVYFKYPTRPKIILRGIDLKINASQKVALVGPSGCGKSTILALLQRFYDVDRGEILIDGVPIKNYDLRHLRKHFGVVSQEPTLFNSTIEDAIRYATKDATFEDIKHAAEEANALKFIENGEFEELGAEKGQGNQVGFQRMVGSKGNQMSGGQKQRIAIARAILTRPNVLLLDEATSALDSQNEKVVQASLDKVMQGKTSVIVAHRISTIKDADQIVVFLDGNIVERGTYSELIKQQKVFYKLEKGLPIN